MFTTIKTLIPKCLPSFKGRGIYSSNYSKSDLKSMAGSYVKGVDIPYFHSMGVYTIMRDDLSKSWGKSRSVPETEVLLESCNFIKLGNSKCNIVYTNVPTGYTVFQYPKFKDMSLCKGNGFRVAYRDYFNNDQFDTTQNVFFRPALFLADEEVYIDSDGVCFTERIALGVKQCSLHNVALL